MPETTGNREIEPPARRRWSLAGVTLAIAVGSGVGLGFSSLFYFVSLVLGAQWLSKLSPLMLALPPCLAALGLMKSLHGSQSPPSSRLTTWLLVPCVLGAACTVLGFGVFSLLSPHGDWDGWMIWNLRAREIFRGGDHWRDAFQAPIHPDYPWLVPGLIALGWRIVGHESVAVPVAVAAFFTFSTAAVLYSALALRRSTTQAALATLVLFGTMTFVTESSRQYADVPIGFYFLATLVLLALYDTSPVPTRWLLVVAGMTTGLAAWTKNEGLVFVVAVIVTRVVIVSSDTGVRSYLREAAAFAAGLLPVLLCVVYFKLQLAPANDLIAGQGLHETLGRLRTGSRYFVVARAFKDQVASWSSNNFLAPMWVLAIYAICVGPRADASQLSAMRTPTVVLGLVLAGYAFTYVTTPLDLERHLASSLDRLLLQLWPSLLFGYFWAMRSPEQAA
jgi:hypothetical protein